MNGIRISKANLALATLLFDAKVFFADFMPCPNGNRLTRAKKRLCLREGARMLQEKKTLSYSIEIDETLNLPYMTIAWTDGESYHSFYIYVGYISKNDDMSFLVSVLDYFHAREVPNSTEFYKKLPDITIDDAVLEVVNFLTILNFV